MYKRQEQAAEALKLTADDLLRQGIIDRIVPEPLGGAHTEPEAMAGTLKEMLVEELRDLMSKESDVLVRERVDKFSGMGVWDE